MIWLTKTVLLLQLIHIFAPTGSAAGFVYWAAHVLIWGNLVLYVATLIGDIFQCIPTRRIWNIHEKGHCININAAFAFTGSANVVSDVLILLLPMWAIWNLQLAPGRKLGISAVFATGLM